MMSGRSARRPGELVFLFLLLGAGLFAIREAQRLGGFANLSGPGFFPMLASTVMVASLAAVIWQRVREGEPFGALRRFFHDVMPLRLVVVTALVAAYVAVMPELGFMAASGLFLFVMLLYLWRRGFWLALAVTAASLVVIQIVFRMVFQVVLPVGRLWQAGSFW
jgi:putative tricarboxylic transport membrane protein